MASAAEQLAASFNFSALAKAHELKQRIWFTIGALIVFRFLSFVPLPGSTRSSWRSSTAAPRARSSTCSTPSRAARWNA